MLSPMRSEPPGHVYVAHAPNRANTPVVAAIIVVALIMAGAIFLATRPADECEKWNGELGQAGMGVVYTRDAISNLDAHRVTLRAELREAQSEMRTVLAEKPNEDCEIDDETKAILEENSL